MKYRIKHSQPLTFENIIGKLMLIGITKIKDDTVVEQSQFHGVIVYAKENDKISIEMENGSLYSLPPDLSNISVANPGEYRERSTGKIIVNPDLISSWTIKLSE